jgi:5-methyltetrahydrofolate--homocysteine methyltransferase
MTVEKIYSGVVNGKKADVEAEVREALKRKTPAEIILAQGLIAAMAEVGARFERGEFYVPEMLVAARAMQSGLAVLRPHLVNANVPVRGKVVLGTVRGDMHDIGKNLVGMMLEGAGYDIVDLGTDVPPQRFAEAARDPGVSLVGMSALLTTTMRNMPPVIGALEDAGLRSRVKVMVGGAPLTEAFAKQIGADGYAPDASRAVALAEALTQGAS